MLVVQCWMHDGGPDAGTPLPPLQPVDILADSTVETGWYGDGLESRQNPTYADC